ncbi:MAG: hypothetical protein JW976_12750 [Syntrophaceae bacterium]|nr:hypothetical protein [Syntrophaceae bacterium]
MSENQVTSRKKIEDDIVMRRKKWIEQHRDILETLSLPQKQTKKIKKPSKKRTKEIKAVSQKLTKEIETISDKLTNGIMTSVKNLFNW